MRRARTGCLPGRQPRSAPPTRSRRWQCAHPQRPPLRWMEGPTGLLRPRSLRSARVPRTDRRGLRASVHAKATLPSLPPGRWGISGGLFLCQFAVMRPFISDGGMLRQAQHERGYEGLADNSATTPKWSDNSVSPCMLLITPRDSAARSSLNATWSMVRRPWKASAAVAMVMRGEKALWSAERRLLGSPLPVLILWLKSPTTMSRFEYDRWRTRAKADRYCLWSSHGVLRSNLRPVSVRESFQGIQTPITVTSPTGVCVTPDTNRPGGSDSLPRSSQCSHGSFDHSRTFRRPSLIEYP